MRLERTFFVHFGVNTFNEVEWGSGREDFSLFNPTELDANQWCRAMRHFGTWARRTGSRDSPISRARMDCSTAWLKNTDLKRAPTVRPGRRTLPMVRRQHSE